MTSKTVLVVCGTGVATSTVVAHGVTEAMSERGISVTTRQATAADVRSHLNGVDLIVCTTPVPDDLGVPVIHTIAFLTGIGKDEAIDQIAEQLGG